MTPHYQSPAIAGYEPAVKDVLKSFLLGVSSNPAFVADRAVHDATVYVMQHLPAGLARVDGNVIEPLLREVIEELLNAPAAPAQPKENIVLRTAKNVWNKLLALTYGTIRQQNPPS